MRFLSLLSVVLLAAVLTGCGNTVELFGHDRDEFLQLLVDGEIDLRELELDESTLSDAFRVLGAGDAYYFSYVLEQEGFGQASKLALRYEVENGVAPYRLQAALKLSEVLESAAEWEQLRELLAGLSSSFPHDRLLHRRYGEALYRLEQDRELLEFISETRRSSPELFSGAHSDLSAESALWQAVLAVRSGSSRSAEHLRALFLEFPAGIVHSRVYLYLIASPQRVRAVSAAEFALYAGRFHQAERRHEQAWQSYAKALPELRKGADGVFGAGALNEVLVADLGATLAGAGRLSHGAAYLAELATELDPPTRSVALEWRGRLLRALGNIPAAVDSFEAALEERPDDEMLRRLLVSAALQGEPRAALRVFERHASQIRSPQLHADALSAAMVRFVSAADWDSIWSIYRQLDTAGTETVRAQYAFVLSVAVLRHNFRPAGIPTGDRRVFARELLQTAHSLSRGHYGLIAGALLHPGRFLSSVSRMQETETPDLPLPGGTAGPWDQYVNGFLRYGLVEEAYSAALANPAAVLHETLVRVSEALVERELYLESIRLATRLRFQPDYIPHRRAEQRAFPQLFAEDVRQVVELRELDIDVFYGLLREESHFAPAIISHAGAVGLSQLMPATARDVAARLRLVEPDLVDPATNLLIGSYYLSGLIERFPTLMHALAAYNAGQGRVRSWLNSSSYSSDFFFHEAIPFFETRDYIRKILVSAVHYGELYHNRPASETITVIFPELEQLAELLQTH